MKVLYVCHRLPYPPKRGGKIRPFNMIRHLNEAGHDVTVASLARSPEEREEGRGLAAHCTRVMAETVSPAAAMCRMLIRVPFRTPSSMGYFYSPVLARRLRAVLKHEAFDLIFVHCSSVAQYVAGIDGIPKILDFGDMDSQKWLSYARWRRFPVSAGYRLEGHKLRAAEARLARQFDCCTCTTQAELQTLDSYGIATPTDWFPNGVDSDYFQPDRPPPAADTLCFLGRMDYYPNQQAMLDFSRDCWPLLKAARPELKLMIIGAEPSAEIRRLARLPGVTVTGSVPDVRPLVRAATISLAPLKIARGTQNKILESMAMGVPVICSRVAAGGVDAIPGQHLLVADTPTEMRDAVLAILDDKLMARQLREAARQRILINHDWHHSMQRMEQIIGRSVEAFRSRPAVKLAV